jgi:hypothetical protein
VSRHPYESLPDDRFWSRAVAWPAPGLIDPVGRSVRIRPGDRVATVGSCFAQHLSREIRRLGFAFLETEAAPEGLDPAAARERGYGVFSARYGNVYTVRQALQLFDRAFGAFAPIDDVWPAEGGFVDPFRPRIEPGAFRSADAVRASAAAHLACVRRVFEDCNVLIFTLGLTEAWRSRADGAVYPLAPGVSGGAFDAERHEFANFTVDEVRRDLFALVERLQNVNPEARVILTVSPVPLAATFENRHVLVSTTCSKSILRVAADEAERRYGHVAYFPAYEIATSPAAAGRYVADDLRHITPLGVRHVMNVFGRHFLGVSLPVRADGGGPTAHRDEPDVLCDEDEIETRSSGRSAPSGA